MKYRIILFSLPFLLLSSVVSVAQAETLKWTGCGISKKAYITELAKAFEAKKKVTVKVSGGGATKGIRQSALGIAHVGGSCRHWLKGMDGNTLVEEKSAELVMVAWDALVAIAHPKNPVNNITLAQLKKVYAGEIKRWSDIEGGLDKPIAVVTRKGKYSGVGHMFRLMVFNDQEYDFKTKSLKVKSTGPLEKKVAKVKTAFAMDGISSAKKVNVKLLSIDGVKPTKENIASGAYPLFRPLYLSINRKKAPKLAEEFIDFALSDEGQKIISQQGTVNLAEGESLKAKWAEKAAVFGQK